MNRKKLIPFTSDGRSSTKKLGSLGEACAIKKFTQYGIPVYLPFSENSAADMIIEIGHKLYKIQVKTSTECKNGTTTFKISKQHREFNSGMLSVSNKCYSRDEVDYFVLYDYFNDSLYLYKNTANKKTVKIRHADTVNNQLKRVKYGTKYDFDRNIKLLLNDIDPDNVIDMLV